MALAEALYSTSAISKKDEINRLYAEMSNYITKIVGFRVKIP